MYPKPAFMRPFDELDEWFTQRYDDRTKVKLIATMGAVVVMLWVAAFGAWVPVFTEPTQSQWRNESTQGNKGVPNIGPAPQPNVSTPVQDGRSNRRNWPMPSGSPTASPSGTASATPRVSPKPTAPPTSLEPSAEPSTPPATTEPSLPAVSEPADLPDTGDNQTEPVTLPTP